MTDNAPIHLVVLLRRLRSAPASVGRDSELLGGCERAALGAALALRDGLEATLTAVALGPRSRETAVLSAALAAGCDRAVCVHTSEADSLDSLGFLGAAELLGTALRRIGCDVILCGQRSQGEQRGAIGPALAEFMNMAHLTGVVSVVADGDAVIASQRNSGSLHRFRCSFPVTLCMLASAAPIPELDPRATPRTPVECLQLGDLGVDPRDLGRPILGLAREARSLRHGELFPSGSALVARLVDDHLLP